MNSKNVLNSTLDTRNSELPSGFTLIELAVVLFLMALIAGLSAIFFGNTLPSAKLTATGRELSATIRQARSLAQLKGTSQTVLVNLDTRRYGIEGRSTKSIPPEIGMKLLDPLLGEVQGGTYRILFEATGGIEGATIDLWNRNRSLRIVTDPVLGTVTLKQ
ncbi:MAG TPA: prepilin-type N-terminal cleavage/methylation domain-containing protein [Syntrophorhabdales bacterium]|nr:prepilin-type N-terminal cleavage/methylation domain-containing protein [Syntrophorhabdales bacterium]